MHIVGTFVQFIGGAVGRVAAAALIVGVFFVVVGVTPWQFIANFISNPPGWIDSPLFRIGILILGLVIIGYALMFNRWSQKQKAIDSLAEDMAWAIRNLLNRSPRPTSKAEIDQWEQDFQTWCKTINGKLENRAFFTRADQLHFDMLGFLDMVGMTGNQRFDHLLSMLKLKFKRLRNVINWTQARQR